MRKEPCPVVQFPGGGPAPDAPVAAPEQSAHQICPKRGETAAEFLARAKRLLGRENLSKTQRAMLAAMWLRLNEGR